MKEIGFNTVYAARQHEELEWGHDAPGQAKYLEMPIREATPQFLPYEAGKIKEAGF